MIDLRSDTVTLPTPAMYDAMASARLGDDVYGEDPAVQELEREAAAILGLPAALFVTSGTQGNLVAMLCHCRHGDGVIVGRDSHVYQYEGGGLAVIGGLVPLVVEDGEGLPAAHAVTGWCRPPDPHVVPARLLCLENTHNRAGGLAVPPDRFRTVAGTARECGLAIHLDGARLFNAAVRWSCDPREYTSVVDSVQVCLSKGLAAPVGSVLCGTAEFIGRARHWRKRLGGGMRQAGVIAAPGLVALRTMRDRLADDHANAAWLAGRLAGAGLAVEEHPWRTNMVFVRLAEPGETADPILCRCAAHGVAVGSMGPRRIRLVTHAGITRDDVEQAAAVLIAALAS